jgi:hypothetical protein
VKRCDFVQNALAGLDIRRSPNFAVEDVLANGNAGGWISISDGATGTVTGAAAVGAQAFGFVVKEASHVMVTDLTGQSHGIPDLGLYENLRSSTILKNLLQFKLAQVFSEAEVAHSLLRKPTIVGSNIGRPVNDGRRRRQCGRDCAN